MFGRVKRTPPHLLNMVKVFDIGANLVDAMYQGFYNGKQVHEPDIENVLNRSYQAGVEKVMLTASTAADTRSAIEIIKMNTSSVYLSTTLGVHPCCANLITEKYISDELELLINHKDIRALGEMGLDYDRLNYADKETQLFAFEMQLERLVSLRPDLTLFLHMRSATDDFVNLISKHRHKFKNGVVHSFTDGPDAMQKILDLDLYVGINGCSLKTEEGIETVRRLPLERMLLESDAPWCELRQSHAGWKYLRDWRLPFKTVDKYKHTRDAMVKGRNEPAGTRAILEAVAGIKETSVEEVAQITWQTSTSLF